MKNDNTLHILTGSRTGNASSVAELTFGYFKHFGYDVVHSDMQEFDFTLFPEIRNLIVVVSTHGEGEPPVQAESFYEYLHGADSPASMDFRYAVCGLGDSSYRYYCQTGKDIDKRLEELGGNRLVGMVSCDIDFEETAMNWVKTAVAAFKIHLKPIMEPKNKSFNFVLKQDGKSDIYNARILQKKLLTGPDSSKKVLHVSLSLKNSGMEYEPGDTLAIFGTNSRLFVDELLSTMKFDKTYPVKKNGNIRMLKDLLIHDYDLTLITPLMIRKYARLTGKKEMMIWMQDDEAVQNYTERHDIIDLVTDFPYRPTVEEFLSILRKLNPRKYSVASSRKINEETADITVKVIENKGPRRTRHGVVSSLLWERLEEGDKVPVELEPIPKFRLPEDPDTPVIMVCAGTGIAPFRGFLQERKALRSKGKNWLFFGDRNRKSDFLYEEDLQTFVKENYLNRLTTAFSRDHNTPVYVSHRMEELGADIVEWLEKGAIIYVCGSKTKLSRSVSKSIITLLKINAGMDRKEASEYFENLKKERRYVKEVY